MSPAVCAAVASSARIGLAIHDARASEQYRITPLCPAATIDAGEGMPAE